MKKKKYGYTVENICIFTAYQILDIFIYVKLGTLNLIYMYDLKLRFFYIKHDFLNAFVNPI